MESLENPVASVGGKPLHQFPKDLFIPPHALEVLLETFTGPLDLLLYLIRKQNMDILDIPIALITDQYMHYIYLLEKEQFELAADYLVMAALLAEIKSRMLLPSPIASEEEESDPRLLLVKKLQLYEQFKQAALNLDAMPRYERDFYPCQITISGKEALMIHPEVDVDMLMQAMLQVMNHQTLAISHQIIREQLSVQARMIEVLEQLNLTPYVEFTRLLKREEERKGLMVTFLAILELARQSLLAISQISFGAPIYLTKIAHE